MTNKKTMEEIIKENIFEHIAIHNGLTKKEIEKYTGLREIDIDNGLNSLIRENKIIGNVSIVNRIPNITWHKRD